MFEAIIALTVLALFFGLILGLASVIFKVKSNPVVDQIDKLLPQTQCTQCTFAGCRPYAQAIADGKAEINLCPPGGEQTVQALASLLDREVLELAEEDQNQLPTVAVIDEQTCIGCTLCIQACPVDAILGASKLMHTVISAECTGCDLCLPPCPVDCIEMVAIKVKPSNWKRNMPTFNVITINNPNQATRTS